MQLPASGRHYPGSLKHVRAQRRVYSRGARYRQCLRLSCCQTLDARFIGAVERLGAIAKELAAAAR
ncbi:conserved protein of unknown function [Stenotrophomonas maltophilia]|nr:conserved protein of unknown function [Stenotrophomonas maltophilia]